MKILTAEDLEKIVEDRLKGLLRCSCTYRIFEFWNYIGCCPGQTPIGIILWASGRFLFTNESLEIVV